ncbi:FtsX-like permease family protein [Desulfosporosinus nitroreducens]|uniref:FtsX-like permease family protein n=1 Tax=Desulfosporosinus nitroreducens TaxID=2018668 RepID=UPI00207C3FA7|nr:FtsX-like permease family protein [Desulfosporosinus nitroreducens]MCO1601616.1 FtsX-like permease family protein [Desulfosporosinus nitroreducens]
MRELLSIKLALAYFRRRKLRAILNTLSVAVAIAALVALQGLNSSIDYARGEFASLLGGNAHLEVKAPQGGMSDTLLAKVQKTAGVQAAVPFVQSSVQVKGLPGFTTLMGIVPGEDAAIRTYRVTQGRMPAQDHREIAVPKELLRGKPVKVGDIWQVQTMLGMQDFTLVGILEDSGVAQTNGGAVVFMPLTTAQKAFELEGKLSYISIVLQNPDNVLAVQKALQESLGNRVEVLTPLGRDGTKDKMLGFIKSLNNVYGFMGLFLALYVMYNSMRVAVSEQRRQLGILRALGWRRWEIHKLIIAQSIVIGVIGSSLGLLLGTYLAQGLLSTVSETLSQVFKVSIPRIRFTMLDYAMIWLTGVLSCLLSAWLPAWKAANIAPIEAMNSRYSKIELGYPRWRIVVGAILILSSWLILVFVNNMSLLFQAALTGIVIGAAVLMPPFLIIVLDKLEPMAETMFGLTGRLGLSSFRRTPRRSVATGMPILLGLAVAFGFLGILASVNLTFGNWVNTLISSDIVITQGLQTFSSNQVGLPEALLERVRKVDGVRVAAGLRTTGIQWHGNPLDLQIYDVLDSRQLATPHVLEPGKDEAWDAIKQEGNIWISESMALKYGVHRGEKLEIPTPAGNLEFPVVAIIKDFYSYNGSVYMNRQDYLRYWGDHSIDHIYLTLEPGVSPALVRDRLEADLQNDFRVQVALASDFRDSMIKLNRSICDIFNLVIIVIVLVAAVGTANSMLISVLERVREIGTLRSVGLTRGQIRSVLLIEVGSLFIAGIVLSIPVAAGIQIGGTIFDKNVNGWVLDVSIPWAKNIGVALVMALVVGLSTLYPAWLASKVDPVKALRSE